MKKLLQPGDVLLLGLAGVLDVFEEVRDPFGLNAQGCNALYGWVPARYRRHNFSRVMARKLTTGDVDKVVKGDDVYLRLTSAGRERIVRDFPMFSLAVKPWDRRWRVVVFDIAEIDKSTRDALRNKLRELGLGMLQESVWITPHDVSVDLREFLEHHELGDAAFVLEISKILSGDEESLVRKIWHLDELEDAYRDIIEDVTKLRNMYVIERGRVIKHTSKKIGILAGEARKIRRRYLEALLSDPCLPKELLPDDWPASKARQIVQDLKKISTY